MAVERGLFVVSTGGLECQRETKTNYQDLSEPLNSSGPEYHRPLNVEGEMFVCSVWGKNFKHQRDWKRHPHTRVKVFQCTECGKSFDQLHSLKKHHTIHSEEKLYTCTVCGQGFN
ncbi:oocyte zinc finger protein XlCOF19-like isoform X2 [Carcharodon carcharias]|uniref:oocyte zinc finger protein XlCOF19-like isoform X2 n=1 Tax=Carcharodon carcharias TaxID=13397 RepID=UPI001B7F2103|nr:oocyte zinc finger protein XlCOF19-like isoform X2 [Carcharodon carcharias]